MGAVTPGEWGQTAAHPRSEQPGPDFSLFPVSLQPGRVGASSTLLSELINARVRIQVLPLIDKPNLRQVTWLPLACSDLYNGGHLLHMDVINKKGRECEMPGT